MKLKPGINWVSFPRLPEPVWPAHEILEQLTDYPNEIKLKHFKISNDGLHARPVEFRWEFGTWTYYFMTHVTATQGYKLTIFPEEERYMILTGNVADPTTSIKLWANYDNWIGYFLEEPMRVEDAFEGYWDQIYSVKHQDWVIYGLQAPPPNPDGSMDFTLRYGDMVIVDVVSDISDFQWPSGDGAAIKTAIRT
ncbi:MAG: hypothetical protein U5Q03_09400 [Bacteroidota bacterium]|nr:hypothetical protein [Bacteroidota bacterium]